MIVFLRNLNNKEKINVINALYDKSPVMPVFYDYRKPINRIVISTIIGERVKSLISESQTDSPGLYGVAMNLAISNGISLNTKYTLNSMVNRGTEIMFDPKIPGDSCICLNETKLKELSREKASKLESEMGAEFLFINFISRSDVAAAITNKSSVMIIDEPDENIIEFAKVRGYKIIFFNKSADKIEESESVSVFSAKKEITHLDASTLFESAIDQNDGNFDFVKEVLEKENEKIVKFKIMENIASEEVGEGEGERPNDNEKDEEETASKETVSMEDTMDPNQITNDEGSGASGPWGYDNNSFYNLFIRNRENLSTIRVGRQRTNAA